MIERNIKINHGLVSFRDIINNGYLNSEINASEVLDIILEEKNVTLIVVKDVFCENCFACGKQTHVGLGLGSEKYISIYNLIGTKLP